MANIYQASQYEGWVRTKLDDTSFSPNVLLQFLNDVSREICNAIKWPFMESLFVGIVSANKNSYDLLATIPDYQQLISFELLLPSDDVIFLDYMPYEEFDQRYPAPLTMTANTPLVWTRYGNTLIFGPGPVDINYTIQAKYIKVPGTAVNDADTIDVPDDFSELVVLGMYARALELNDQPDYAVAQYNRFQQQLGVMKQRYGIREVGTPLVLNTRRTLLRGK